MMTPHPTSDRFQALSDPTRLRICKLLESMELSVGELAQVLGQTQPRVSRHIKLLDEAGLIVRRKEASWVFVQLGAAYSDTLAALIDRWLTPDERAQVSADAARLDRIARDRADAAEAWFARHAEGWDAIRSLHVAESEVERALVEALGDRPLGRLVDVGTGTGRMLELLGARADSAIGIDRSADMLRLARVKLAGQEGVTLRLGDMYALPLPDRSADHVVLHQLLHYAHDPRAVIAEAARLLAPGGRLLIVDFAPHAHEDLRIRDAHARLGFSDSAMAGWFEGAGLSLDRIDRLDGGSLAVVLWRGSAPGDAARQSPADEDADPPRLQPSGAPRAAA